MSLALMLVCVWIIVANVIAALPSRDHHWTAAYILIVTGVPLDIWVFWQHGWGMGLLVFAAGASMLHWPIRFALRWVVRKLRGRDA